MSVLFAVRPGYAVSVREASAAPLMLGLTDWGDISSGGGFANQKAIITGCQISEQPNYQIQNTLNKFLYVYSFGNMVGDLALSGITFSGNCDDGGGPGNTGLDRIRRYYKAHRLSTRPRPMAVAVGGESFSAFLVGCAVNIDNPQAGLGMFNFAFKTIPDN